MHPQHTHTQLQMQAACIRRTGSNHRPHSILVAALYCVSHIVSFSSVILAILNRLCSIAIAGMQIPAPLNECVRCGSSIELHFKQDRWKWKKTKRMHLATAHWIELYLCHAYSTAQCSRILCAFHGLVAKPFFFFFCLHTPDGSYVCLVLRDCFTLCVSFFRCIPLPRSTHWNYAVIAFRCVLLRLYVAA